jgi:hypothetical protein
MAKARRSVADVFLSDPKQLLTMIQTALGLGVAFGVPVSAEQMGALVAFLSSFIIWLNSQQPTPKDLQELTKAADATVRTNSMLLDEVKTRTAAATKATKS